MKPLQRIIGAALLVGGLTFTGSVGAAAAPELVPDGSTSAYAEDGKYFFKSPSGKWGCGIVPSQTHTTAGCYGPFPASVPRVPGSGAPNTLVRPNTVIVTTQNVKARFISIGDAQFYPRNGNPRVLPYGRVLTVGAISCSIGENSGVTCNNKTTGHGFTVSNTAYRLR